MNYKTTLEHDIPTTIEKEKAMVVKACLLVTTTEEKVTA